MPAVDEEKTRAKEKEKKKKFSQETPIRVTFFLDCLLFDVLQTSRLNERDRGDGEGRGKKGDAHWRLFRQAYLLLPLV